MTPMARTDVLPRTGKPVLVCPGFEEGRLREQLRFPIEVRVWQEDESPTKLAAAALADQGVRTGRLGVEETAYFTYSDHFRAAAPGFEYVSADPVTIACRGRKSPHELELMWPGMAPPVRTRPTPWCGSPRSSTFRWPTPSTAKASCPTTTPTASGRSGSCGTTTSTSDSTTPTSSSRSAMSCRSSTRSGSIPRPTRRSFTSIGSRPRSTRTTRWTSGSSVISASRWTPWPKGSTITSSSPIRRSPALACSTKNSHADNGIRGTRWPLSG